MRAAGAKPSTSVTAPHRRMPCIGRGESERGEFSQATRVALQEPQALQAELSSTLFDKLDDETWERLEEALILADVGREDHR
jgi:hypothetical protein